MVERVPYIKIAWNDKNVRCDWVPDGFYFAFQSRSAGRRAQTYDKMIIVFSIFNHLCPFPQVFRQVKEWLILELHEIIRVLHVVACPIDFSLLCDGVRQERVLKPTKNDHFQALLAASVLFLKFLGRLMSGVYWNCMKW